MKPCSELGAASALWMYNYTEIDCNEKLGDTCPADYQQWCCGGSPCMTYNDKCQVFAKASQRHQ